jgi:hypothetical protein
VDIEALRHRWCLQKEKMIGGETKKVHISSEGIRGSSGSNIFRVLWQYHRASSYNVLKPTDCTDLRKICGHKAGNRNFRRALKPYAVVTDISVSYAEIVQVCEMRDENFRQYQPLVRS